MSVLPKEIMRKKFKRDLAYWLLLWFTPIISTLVAYFGVYPQYSIEVQQVLNMILVLMWLTVIASAVLMIPVIFFEWFPAEYYEDLTECPVCGEEEVKCVNDCKCYSCGANKEEMDAVGVAG